MKSRYNFSLDKIKGETILPLITERSDNYRLTLFGMLYFVQGVTGAFTINFAKPYLNQAGVDADQIALLFVLLLIPFIIKIVYGILSDRINLFGWGHRIPYIVIALIISALGIALAGFVDPGASFWLFAVLILFNSFAVALFDTTADALAVDITPEEDQGRVQSIMTGGRAVGFVIMSLLIGWIAQRFGFFSVFIIISLLMLTPLFWVLAVREPADLIKTDEFSWSYFGALGRPSWLIFALYALISWFIFSGTDGLITFYLDAEFGASETQIGTFGALRGIGTIIGALVFGLIIGRLGKWRTAILATILVAVGAFSFSFLPSIGIFLLAASVWGFFNGIFNTIFMVFAMERTDPAIAGSMFAISMSVINIGTAIGEGVATSLTDNIGFVSVFQLLAASSILIFPVLWFMQRTERTTMQAHLDSQDATIGTDGV
ncbi:MAG: MFS transporter [Chloroflexota bacterium]